MSGIAGPIKPPDDAVQRATGEQMYAALERRGPDSHGLFLARDVGLATQYLLVPDLATSFRGGSILFASELPASTTDRRVPRDLDLDAVDCSRVHGHVATPLCAWFDTLAFSQAPHMFLTVAAVCVVASGTGSQERNPQPVGMVAMPAVEAA